MPEDAQTYFHGGETYLKYMVLYGTMNTTLRDLSTGGECGH